MPFIVYTYPADVAEHGSEPIEVPEVSAKVLTERRRAEIVPAPVESITGPLVLDEACDECPDGDCDDCPLS